MRKFKKGDTASRHLTIAAVREDGDGNKILDLALGITRAGSGSQEEWKDVPLSDLVLGINVKTGRESRIAAGALLKIEMTADDIRDDGVVFNIGGGRLLFMNWDEIRNYWGDDSVPDIRPALSVLEKCMNEERVESCVDLYESMITDREYKSMLIDGLRHNGSGRWLVTESESARESVFAKGKVSVKFMAYGICQHLLISYDGRRLSKGTEFCLAYAVNAIFREMGCDRKLYNLWLAFLRDNRISDADACSPSFNMVGEFTRFCVKRGVSRVIDPIKMIEDVVELEADSVPGFLCAAHYVRDADGRECWLGQFRWPLLSRRDEKALEDPCQNPGFEKAARQFMRDTAIFARA